MNENERSRALGLLLTGAINQALTSYTVTGVDGETDVWEGCCNKCCGPCWAVAWFHAHAREEAETAIAVAGVLGDDWSLEDGRPDWDAVLGAWSNQDTLGCHDAGEDLEAAMVVVAILNAREVEGDEVL